VTAALPDEHYRTIASLYDEQRVAAPAAPNVAIAERYNVPKSTADRWVKRAKELGYIHRTPICRGHCPACCPRSAVTTSPQ
jgi:DNA-binding MarR family transcriptional regulator